jgi:hypothetical protein
MSALNRPYGLLAEFETPADVKQAAALVRQAGYQYWDVYTPFPIHGMDAAMGLRRSPVGWPAFLGGVAGLTLGLLMIWYMNAFDYPLIVGGKPYFSPVYALPVSYELTILFSAFGAVLGMLIVNRLPRWHHPLLRHARFARVTHDRFFIVIECSDPKYSERQTRQLLAAAGSNCVEIVEQ